MPKRNVVVDRVQRIEFVKAWDAVGPRHGVVHVQGGASLIDFSDARSRAWAEVLDDLRRNDEPVYLETDPETNVVTQVLYPLSAVVSKVADSPSEGRHEVELEISAARHHLDTANPDYPLLLDALKVAMRQGARVLVTETTDDHAIIDVRPDPRPFDVGPAKTLSFSAGPFNNLAAAAGTVTLQQAQQMFQLVASQQYIPFNYPDDGCWGRAHEMTRLILANGFLPRKVWNYGSLRVSTRNHPSCSVTWGWHVAPTLVVQSGSGADTYVLDPAMFAAPVPQADWVAAQNDPQAAQHDTDATVFYRNITGQTSTDPGYAQTQQVLGQFRRALALRTATSGPPPYANCP